VLPHLLNDDRAARAIEYGLTTALVGLAALVAILSITLS
jgi:Flp pilus assembly pilin Flp